MVKKRGVVKAMRAGSGLPKEVSSHEDPFPHVPLEFPEVNLP